MNQVSQAPLDSQEALVSFWNEPPTTSSFPWYVHALHHATQSYRSVRAAPVTALLTLLIMTLVLTLFTLFLVFLLNMKGVLLQAKGNVSVTLFLKEGVSELGRKELQNEIEKYVGVEKSQFFSKEVALKEFKARLGKDAVLLEGLEGENPLPASIEVRFKTNEVDADESPQGFAEQFLRNIQNDSRIDLGQLNESVFAQVMRSVHSFKRSMYVGVVFVLLLSGFVIALTVRLALYAHRQEIEIMQLVGATQAYIQIPFIIEGAVQGAVGGVLSLILSDGVSRAIQERILNDDMLSILIPPILFLSPSSSFIVVFMGILIGSMSSYFAVKRFIVSSLGS